MCLQVFRDFKMCLQAALACSRTLMMSGCGTKVTQTYGKLLWEANLMLFLGVRNLLYWLASVETALAVSHDSNIRRNTYSNQRKNSFSYRA